MSGPSTFGEPGHGDSDGVTAAAASWRNPRWQRLVCSSCGAAHDLDRLQTVCERCQLPLRVDYALDASALPRAALRDRPTTLWRYAEVLPVAPAHAVTIGEGWTPLLPVAHGRVRAFVKDEARNPTGSFKARGMTVAVSAARALGAKGLRAPSAGNAAGALSAYGAAAGLPVVVAMPRDTPAAFVEECRLYGARVDLVDGTIADAGRHLRESGPADHFDVSTLREPHRVEGKKTMAYELYEQGGLPDVIVYPTGGGTGLVGMWKAFDEMRRLGWLAPTAKPPRLVSVQVATCAPVVKAFAEGAARTEPWPNPSTRAWGLRVPSPIGGFLCLRALRETGGTAIAVGEAELEAATRALASRTGLDVCPEGGAAWAAMNALIDRGAIAEGERVVVFNTGTGLKYR
jgi:threonine synthase